LEGDLSIEHGDLCGVGALVAFQDELCAADGAGCEGGFELDAARFLAVEEEDFTEDEAEALEG
jgi:hypothetical protein